MEKINMKILNKKMSAAQFARYLRGLKIYPWTRRIKRIVLHHTSSPVDTWQGSGSMLHYWNLYRSRGWKSGPHIFIAPNGVWLFTPITKKGTCSVKEADKNSIHIEVVGRYYDKFPKKDIESIAADVIVSIMEKFWLPFNSITNHFSFDSESNCTPILDKDWAKKIIKKSYHITKKI